ncbi:MAG TPA: glycosyltransferase [Bacteroidales bacterium]|nr:glycosyltransferase [Bacteroidales bacterium]
MMSDPNPTKDLSSCVHALWIGNQLSPLEILTIESFLQCGHSFVLWTYDKIITPLTKQLIQRDAGLIISREQVFAYRNKNQFGHGKGSYAGFSDIFRYKVLYEYGGWWADMDITCLKPLDFKAPYVFRTHHDLKVVGNIMKCPPKSELMKRCYERAIVEVDADNRDWNKPIQILNDVIEELGLQQYIVEMSNRDSWNDVRKMIAGKKEIPEEWFVIHWVNEEWRRNMINKNYTGRNSALNDLHKRYGVPLQKLPLKARFINRLKLSFTLAVVKYAWSWGREHLAYYFRQSFQNKKPR